MTSKSLFIFDMDGVLLESEVFWRKAQIDLLKQYGFTITEQDCINNTMGKRLDDIANTWIDKFQIDVDPASFGDEITTQVCSLIKAHGKPLPGVLELIEYLNKSGFTIALATSSNDRIINAVSETLNITKYFELMQSADYVAKGKPAPDVYLTVCKKLGVPTNEAIALEDSLTGVKAAVAANITTIAVPEFESSRFSIADYVVNSACEVPEIIESLNG